MSAFIRQFHRWTSIVFTLAVVAAFVALGREHPIVWVSYLPLPPLFVLSFSGLYLLALPHLRARNPSRDAR